MFEYSKVINWYKGFRNRKVSVTNMSNVEIQTYIRTNPFHPYVLFITNMDTKKTMEIQLSDADREHLREYLK